MKWALRIVLLLLLLPQAWSQVATVTGQAVDSDGTQWVGGTYQIRFINAQPGTVAYRKDTLQPFPASFQGTLDSTGSFSLQLTETSFIVPSNSLWQFTICSAVTGWSCGTFTTSITASGSVTSQIAAVIKAPRVTGGPGISAYSDIEVAAFPNNSYFNLTSQQNRCYGTSWGVCGGGSGGSLPTASSSNQVPVSSGPGIVYTAQAITPPIITFTQTGTGAVSESLQAKLQSSLNIKDFGAVGGNPTLDTAGLRNAVAVATATGASVYVPAGNYLLNNSSGPVLSGANNVLIWGDGPASSLACNTIGAADCLQSTGATGFGLANLSISFTPTATTRSSGYVVDIETCNRCTLSDLTLNNGDLSGLRLASSQHTAIRNLRVSGFEANGTFMINNQDLTIDGLSCSSNGDACFEVSWFDSEYSTYAIPCENITASNIRSSNDVEAILVNSCRNVSVTGFSSAGSAKEAVFVGQDPTTTTTHWPDRVAIADGTIYGSGYGTNPLNVATAQALYVNMGTSPGSVISHVEFSNITASHISSWGLQMAELQNTDLQLSNLQFYDVGNAANSGGTGVYSGCLQTEGNQVNYSNVSCTDVGTYILYDTNTNRLTGTNLIGNAANQQGSGTNAVYLSASATGYVMLTGISLNDTNATTYTSSVYDGSSSGYHQMYGIWSQGLVTPTGPTSANSGTTYTYADPTHSLVTRNGGQILSFAPPNLYLVPTAGTTGTSQVPGAIFYWQGKCRATPTSSEQTASIGWALLFPTLTTESFALNPLGGCGFPLVLDTTAATTVSGNQFTGTSFNNVAFTTPASLATLTILSGQTFTVDKTMTLNCTGCGTYNLDGFAPLASPAFTGTPTAPTQAISTNNTDIATTAAVTTALVAYAPLASPALTGTPSAPTASVGTSSTQVASTAFVQAAIPANTTAFTNAQTAPAFWPQSKSAGPFVNYQDEFMSGANTATNTIGSASGQSCAVNTTYTDVNHPGNLLLTSGTGGSGTGITCGLQSQAADFVTPNNATSTWTWESAVYVPVLPATTGGNYQAGMSTSPNTSPWTGGIGFYLSSANSTQNDWYCRYNTTTTDSTIAATVAWQRLTMINDGTYLHWYVGGTEATACKTAIGSIPSTTQYPVNWSVTASTTTSVAMAVDYVTLQRLVSR